MSEIKNGRLGLYGAEHWKCYRMMKLGFKGLKLVTVLTRLSTVGVSDDLE